MLKLLIQAHAGVSSIILFFPDCGWTVGTVSWAVLARIWTENHDLGLIMKTDNITNAPTTRLIVLSPVTPSV